MAAKATVSSATLTPAAGAAKDGRTAAYDAAIAAHLQQAFAAPGVAELPGTLAVAAPLAYTVTATVSGSGIAAPRTVTLQVVVEDITLPEADRENATAIYKARRAEITGE